MAMPNTRHKVADIAAMDWGFTSDSRGYFSHDQIQSAALLEIVAQLKALNSQITMIRQCHEVRGALRGIRNIMKVVNQYEKPRRKRRRK